MVGWWFSWWLVRRLYYRCYPDISGVITIHSGNPTDAHPFDIRQGIQGTLPVWSKYCQPGWDIRTLAGGIPMLCPICSMILLPDRYRKLAATRFNTKMGWWFGVPPILGSLHPNFFTPCPSTPCSPLSIPCRARGRLRPWLPRYKLQRWESSCRAWRSALFGWQKRGNIIANKQNTAVNNLWVNGQLVNVWMIHSSLCGISGYIYITKKGISCRLSRTHWERVGIGGLRVSQHMGIHKGCFLRRGLQKKGKQLNKTC